MPIRAFVSQTLIQLESTLGMLERAMSSGSMQELRVAGILTRTGPMHQTEVQTRYQQCRYELHLRARALPDADKQKAALMLQYPNPYRETVMRVESRERHLHFGNPPFF